jgi:hypothetical protein
LDFNELERMCKEAAVAKFKTLFPHLPGDTEENHEELQSEYSVSRTDIEGELPEFKSSSFAACVNLFGYALRKINT